MENNTIEEAADVLRKYESFVICGHRDPDADCISSTLALHKMLTKLGKESMAVNEDKMPASLRKLSSVEQINFEYKAEDLAATDVLIIVDSGEANRIGRLWEYRDYFKLCLYIDHHLVRGSGGDINYVDTSAASTTQIVFDIFEHSFLDLVDSDIALQIYCGLAADTGFFRHSNTSDKVFTVASKLIAHGVSVEQVDDMLNRIVEKRDYKFLGRMLDKLETSCSGKIAYSIRDISDSHEGDKKYNISVIDYIMKLTDVQIGFVVKEGEDDFRLSIRSRGEANACIIAEQFGGGGHAKAAGARVLKSEYDEKDLIEKLNSLAKQQLDCSQD